MSGRLFLDSNILIYAVSKHQSDVEKAAGANRIIQTETVCLSVRVLQEFYVNATRKGGMPDDEAAAWVESLLVYECVDLTPTIVRTGIDFSRSYQISY